MTNGDEKCVNAFEHWFYRRLQSNVEDYDLRVGFQFI